MCGIMKIVVSDIPQEGLEVTLKEMIEHEDRISPVEADLRIEKVGTEVLVKGDLNARMALRCSRCLKDFEKEILVPVDVVYHPVEELKAEEEHELRSEELDMGFYSGGGLDLLDLIKEQVMLNLPMKTLCAELCKGICPQCGADLNTGTCECEAKTIDPRLAVLKNLIK